MLRSTLVPLFILLASFAHVSYSDSSVLISEFNTDDLNNWETKEFEGLTQYEIVQLDEQSVLKAHSQHSASGLFVEQTIDIEKTPFLNWKWRIKNPLPEKDETTKQNDDYAARVYVVVSGGWLFWKTKALNFVWSSQKAPAPSWPNAFAPDNALMIPLQTSASPNNTWVSEKQNVYTVLRKWLGYDVKEIHGVAIMTDTDNAGGEAIAYYDDIFFSEK